LSSIGYAEVVKWRTKGIDSSSGRAMLCKRGLSPIGRSLPRVWECKLFGVPFLSHHSTTAPQHHSNTLTVKFKEHVVKVVYPSILWLDVLSQCLPKRTSGVVCASHSSGNTVVPSYRRYEERPLIMRRRVVRKIRTATLSSFQ
jgi:hypothetical protein